MIKKIKKNIMKHVFKDQPKKINSIVNLNLKNKTVLVRVDFNVPIEKVKGKNTKKITDNEKIKASLSTIKYLLKNNCKVVLMSHLGRPKGKVVKDLRLNLVAKELQKLLSKENKKLKVIKLNDCIGPEIKAKIVKGTKKDIFLLENLRFYKEEKENDYAFAHSLADLAEVYVNDAFAVSHRKHASVAAITKFLPSGAGFLLETEILNLSKALKPERPAVWLMGGAKLKKVELLNKALDQADRILIGGALAFSFLKAKGIPVGNSLIDNESIAIAKKLMYDKRSTKIVLPVDFVCVKRMTEKSKVYYRDYNEIKNDEIGLDIGPKTVKLFDLHLQKAKTLVWNGPMGYFEWAKFAKSSKALAKTVANVTLRNKVFSIVGGGETAAMIKGFKLANKFTHISTGGGASLAFISGKKLPGLEALRK